MRASLLTLLLASCLVGAAVGAAVGSAVRLPRPHLAPAKDSRIVGGEAVSIEQFPHQLSLEFLYSHSCGASVISPNWAITAAHCTDGSISLLLRLRAGSSTRGSGGSLHSVQRFVQHPGYDYYTIDNDVSVLLVSTPFEYSATVQAVPLAAVTPAVGSVITVSGWGARREGALLLPSQLQAVDLPVVDHDACDAAYVEYGGVTDAMLCAGLPEGGKDACQGDSGGPLVAGGELVGLVSWGLGCARANYPGVNTDVAYVRSWVLENTGL